MRKSCLLLSLSLLPVLAGMAPPALPARESATVKVKIAPPPPIKDNMVRQYLARAMALLNRNDYRQALDYTDLAIGRDPNCGQIYLPRGYALFKLEKPDQAVQAIEHGFRLLPNRGEGALCVPGHTAEWSYRILVWALLDLSKAKEALQALDQAPESYKKTGTWNDDRGNVYARLNQFDKAVECFGQAIKYDPANKYYYRERGKCYLILKKPVQALADFNANLKDEPQESSLYSLRGDAYKAMGKADLARQDYERANQLGQAEGFTP